MKTNLSERLKSIIRTVEVLGNCHICFHDFYKHILKYIPEVPMYHHNHYCISLKKMFPRQEYYCIKFDRSAVLRHLETYRRPFFKLCPYQLLELVVPVEKDDTIYGVIFMGPYRATGCLPPETLRIASKLTGDMQKTMCPLTEKLTLLDTRQMEHIMNLGHMLASCISETIDNFDIRQNKEETGRKQRIENFIARNFNNSITLETLADFLNLSTSRTSRLLKLYFGSGFSELLNRHRINYVTHTLLRSEITVREAADRAGFDSIEYFHRVFKKQMNMTPLEYRRLNQER